MSERKTVVVVGLGEVGRPLMQVIERHHDVVGIDVGPAPAKPARVDVMHICYPFEIPDFIGETARYIAEYAPLLTIIDTTVAVGTTRAVAERTGAAVVNSPVRGKHVRMFEELLSYVKFVGALDHATGKAAAEHFESLGMRTRVLSTPEASELAKLTETTYFGVLIAWAQELERYCDKVAADYDEVIAFYEEIKFFPSTRYFPGVIGGHCVMPNIEILGQLGPSDILAAVKSSNRMKIEREALQGRSGDGRQR
jgi:UDP-N-acetyl-D-mannosaminuronate dehydrogenase